MKNVVLILLMVILLAAGIFWLQSMCEVINTSSSTLNDVVVSITSDRYSSSVIRKVSQLQPEQKARFRFFAPAEAEVDISFTVHDRQIKAGVISYYEGGAIKITINPDLKLNGSVDIFSH
jgi:hypothetical protein